MRIKFLKYFLICFIVVCSAFTSDNTSFKIAQLKYSGGGDWYANSTSIPNLAKFCNENLGMNIFPERAIVEVGSPELYNYPFIHMTGHGNVIFSDYEASNLREYL
ncbi:MAG: DUF4159 domain-containing protein, partial [Bacteroidia bacterium]|nr:DUF4159 domain-containing protein [Bacteroidia bacterium]